MDGRLGHHTVPRSVFGELALLRSTVRAATIKCLEPCTFLEVKKEDFNHAIKADLLAASYDRMEFFTRYVPGCMDMKPEPAVHPSYFWQKQVFKQGHSFLKEGGNMQPSIWLLVDGEVSVSRRSFTKPEDGDSCLFTLTAGAVFSSMSAVPFEMTEPFTVTVASPSCEVLLLVKKDWDQIPEVVLKAVQTHLRTTMAKRVKHLCIKRALGRDPMGSPRAEGFTDFRDAPATAPTSSIRKAAARERPLSQPSVSLAWHRSEAGPARPGTTGTEIVYPRQKSKQSAFAFTADLAGPKSEG